MSPKWKNIGRPGGGGVADRWASPRGGNPDREGATREGLVEGNMTGVDLLDRLLVSGEGGETPVSNVEDLLEVVGIICDRKGGTGSTNTDPNLASG
jgi:hypothetical protein